MLTLGRKPNKITQIYLRTKGPYLHRGAEGGYTGGVGGKKRLPRGPNKGQKIPDSEGFCVLLAYLKNFQETGRGLTY